MQRATALQGAAPAHEMVFDQSLKALLKPAYRLAYMMLGDREAAEDAVQDAALKSWRKRSSLRPGADPRPWFLGFVANECRNMRRSRWRSVLKLGEREDVMAPDAPGSTDIDLRRALARLSDRDRLLVLLHFYLDLTLEEMAIVTGSRKAAVRSRLYRAVKQLRPHLELREAPGD